MLTEVLAEIIGTFFFVSIIMSVGGAAVLTPLSIGLGLAGAIWAVSKVSLGSLNPAVSIMLYLRGDLDATRTVAYIIAEVIGAILAFMWWSATIGSKKK